MFEYTLESSFREIEPKWPPCDRPRAYFRPPKSMLNVSLTPQIIVNLLGYVLKYSPKKKWSSKIFFKPIFNISAQVPLKFLKIVLGGIKISFYWPCVLPNRPYRNDLEHFNYLCAKFQLPKPPPSLSSFFLKKRSETVKKWPRACSNEG